LKESADILMPNAHAVRSRSQLAINDACSYAPSSGRLIFLSQIYDTQRTLNISRQLDVEKPDRYVAMRFINFAVDMHTACCEIFDQRYTVLRQPGKLILLPIKSTQVLNVFSK
jgi:hypothetical protein